MCLKYQTHKQTNKQTNQPTKQTNQPTNQPNKQTNQPTNQTNKQTNGTSISPQIACMVPTEYNLKPRWLFRPVKRDNRDSRDADPVPGQQGI